MSKTLPVELLNSLEGIEGFDRKNFEAVHASKQPVTSIRFNAAKYQRYDPSGIIHHPNFSITEQVPWCENGFYIDERPSFTLDPLLHAGAYYVQEASSMFLWEILKQTSRDKTNLKVLDLCAAPGGKSTLLASYFKDGLIVSNDVIKSRSNILYENLTKWGAANAVITNNDAADFQRLHNYFDLIVVDAPCSGSGLFRKDAAAMEEWSMNNVELCSQRQERILSAVYPALKNEGVLVYATCSYSQKEDEDVLDLMKDYFALDSIELSLKDGWGITETQSPKHSAYAYRFWPGKVKGEGFFIAALRKTDGEPQNFKYQKPGLVKATNKETSIAAHYLDQQKDWLLFQQKENIHAIDKQWSNDVAMLQKNLYLRKAGVNLGALKGNELVPHHELALSSFINKNTPKFELSLEQALAYLRKKEITINSTYKGWALSTFYNFPLGWIKILHNRVNNYYPTAWRILKY